MSKRTAANALFVSVLSCALLATAAARMARADDDDDAGDGHMIQVGAGAYMEDDEEPTLLLEVEYQGFHNEGASPNVTFFEVGGELRIGRPDEGSGVSVPEFEVNIVPATYSMGDSSIHYLPIRISRDLDLGQNVSATIHVIGWKDSANHVIAGNGDYNRLSAFAEVAVDVVGARYLNLADGRTFVGAQIGSVELAGGLSWDVSRAVTIRLTLGAEGSVGAGGVGGAGSSTAAALGIDSELYAKLESIFHTLHGDFSLFVQGEYERYDLVSSEPTDIGEFALIVGVGGEF